MSTTTKNQHGSPSLVVLLRVWFGIGVQSFGGGVATLALIQKAIITEHAWLSEAEFTRDWALVQIVPGINLLALTILIGRRLRGPAGVAVCVLGLLIPSVTLTVLLTAFYVRVQHAHWVRAGLRGALPAIVGIGFVTALTMARPILIACRRESGASLTVALALLIGSGLFALKAPHVPVIYILCGAGLIGGAANWISCRASAAREKTGT